MKTTLSWKSYSMAHVDISEIDAAPRYWLAPLSCWWEREKFAKDGGKAFSPPHCTCMSKETRDPTVQPPEWWNGNKITRLLLPSSTTWQRLPLTSTMPTGILNEAAQTASRDARRWSWKNDNFPIGTDDHALRCKIHASNFQIQWRHVFMNIYRLIGQLLFPSKPNKSTYVWDEFEAGDLEFIFRFRICLKINSVPIPIRIMKWRFIFIMSRVHSDPAASADIRDQRIRWKMNDDHPIVADRPWHPITKLEIPVISQDILSKWQNCFPMHYGSWDYSAFDPQLAHWKTGKPGKALHSMTAGVFFRFFVVETSIFSIYPYTTAQQ
jgi:hypothetical protein